MSESEVGEEEGGLGEQTERKLSPKPGEGVPPPPVEVVIKEKALTFDEASKCLSQLGKDESGMRYAYLKISPTDRKLTDIRTILNFRHVLFIDVGGNYLNTQALQPLTEMPFLVQLHAQRNFVENLLLRPMAYLQDLSLSRNQITLTTGMEQPMLQYLDLNYNQIYQVQIETANASELKELEIRGNFLFEVGGVLPISLEKIYFAENRITRIIDSDINKLKNLTVLHLRNNLIRKLDGFTKKLENLRYLNVRQNKIKKLRQFRKLEMLPQLETLVLLQNPVLGERVVKGEDVDEDEEEMGEGGGDIFDRNRVSLLVMLPELKRINKMPVRYDERVEAKRVAEERFKQIMAEDSSDEEQATPTTTTEYPTEFEDDTEVE